MMLSLTEPTLAPFLEWRPFVRLGRILVLVLYIDDPSPKYVNVL